MDFELSEEQQSIRDLARKILEDRVTHERLKEVEAGEEWFDRDLWKELAKANLIGTSLGEEYGGMGFGFFDSCLLLQELGRAVAPLPLYPTLVLGAFPIAKFGNAEQKQRFLPGVVNGDRVLTGALEEFGNAEPGRPVTEAHAQGDGFVLDGEKINVSAVPQSERVLLAAKVDGGGIAWFLVNPNAPGVELIRQVTTRREPVYSVRLSRVEVPASDVVGDIANGAAMAEWISQRAMTALCAIQLGVSEAALHMTARYTSDRKQFDRPIGSFQAVHQRAGDAYIQLEAMRLTLWHAASLLDAGESAGDEAILAKYWAAEGGEFVGYAAQHLHGGIGLDVDYPVHRYYLWTRQIQLSLGSAPQLLERIGQGLAENPIDEVL